MYVYMCIKCIHVYNILYIYIYMYIIIYIYVTHLNEMSRISVKLILRKCRFFEKIANPTILRLPFVFILAVITVGTAYISPFYVFWCHVRRGMQSISYDL